MKLLIAVDMEGISGVADGSQTNPSHPDYARFRKIMTADVNAAIEGALEAGVDEVVVADGHWFGLNILIEELHPKARLNSGLNAPLAMIEGIQRGADAVFFIGYHARMGTLEAVLDHTWVSSKIENVWLNNRLAGETALNAATCAHFGAPVILVSGDQALAAEAKEWIPGIETAVVKKGTSRLSAECLPLEEARRIIRQAAHRAVSRFKNGDAPAPLLIKSPITLTVQFQKSSMADAASVFPGCRRLDGLRVEATLPNMPQAYQTLESWANLTD